MVPTRSAQASERPSAVQRVRPSLVIGRSAPARRWSPATADRGPWPGGSDRPRRAPGPGPPRPAAGPRAPSARSSAVDDPWTSTATAGGIRPSPAQASEERSAVRATVSTAGPGGAPASRRSSPAMIGPKKETSARPRPSSSATMAASTPDASRCAASGGGPELPPSRRGHGRVQLGRPLGVAEVGRRRADRAGPTSRAAESRRACCSAREPDVHQPSPGSRGQRRRPLVAERPPQHFPRGQAWDIVDHDDVAEPLVGGQRVGHQRLQLTLGHR